MSLSLSLLSSGLPSSLLDSTGECDQDGGDQSSRWQKQSFARSLSTHRREATPPPALLFYGKRRWYNHRHRSSPTKPSARTDLLVVCQASQRRYRPPGWPTSRRHGQCDLIRRKGRGWLSLYLQLRRHRIPVLPEWE